MPRFTFGCLQLSRLRTDDAEELGYVSTLASGDDSCGDRLCVVRFGRIPTMFKGSFSEVPLQVINLVELS